MTNDQQLIYDYVRQHGNIKVSDAANITYLKQSQVITILDYMVEQRVLVKKDHVFILAPKRKEKIDQPKMF